MTTVHANTPRDALSRVEQMIGMAGLDISPRSIRQQIASAMNVVIQTERLEDGRRRIVSVSEITGMEQDVISMQEIYRFRRRGTDKDGTIRGEFEATGIRPQVMELFAARGIEISGLSFAPSKRAP
jgi:pilus assembly protein CpaF